MEWDQVRVGIGYDAHPLSKGRALILGGVSIEWERGLMGHSDADVLVHAIIDALLGAASLKDIGHHFPASDPSFKGVSSLLLLRSTRELLAERGWQVINIDATVVAQRPRLKDFLEGMRSNVAGILDMEAERVNIKAKCPEGLGFCGKEEGIEAIAVALIIKKKG